MKKHLWLLFVIFACFAPLATASLSEDWTDISDLTESDASNRYQAAHGQLNVTGLKGNDANTYIGKVITTSGIDSFAVKFYANWSTSPFNAESSEELLMFGKEFGTQSVVCSTGNTKNCTGIELQSHASGFTIAMVMYNGSGAYGVASSPVSINTNYCYLFNLSNKAADEYAVTLGVYSNAACTTRIIYQQLNNTVAHNFTHVLYDASKQTGGVSAHDGSLSAVEDLYTVDFTTIRNNASVFTTTNDTVNWTTTIFHNTYDLNTCWFSHNMSGTYVNETVQNCNGVNTYVFNQNLKINVSSPKNICAYYSANASDGTQQNSTLNCITTTNGMRTFNISAINRYNNTILNVLNATFNSTLGSFSNTSSNGVVYVTVPDGTFTIRINVSGLGYTIINPFTVTETNNLSVRIPNLVIQEFSQDIVETEAVNFGFTLNGTDDQLSNVVLNFNNSVHQMTKTAIGQKIHYNVTLLMPDIEDMVEEFLYNFTYTINPNSTSENFLFNVSEAAVELCGPEQKGNITINVTFYDENNPNTETITRVESEFLLYKGIRNITLTENMTATGASVYSFCLRPPGATIQTDALFVYNATDTTHRYYLRNHTLTNTTQFLSMFNILETSGLSDLRGTVRDKLSFQPISGIVTSLMRKYVGEGKFRTVQMDESGDFGLVFFNVYEEDTIYKLEFMNENGTVLKTTDELKLSCDSNLCQLTFVLDQTGATLDDPVLGVTTSFNNVTGVYTVTWNDPEGRIDTVRVLVTKETLAGTASVCDQTFTGSSGTVDCDTSSYNGPFTARIISTASPPRFSFTEVITPFPKNIIQNLGGIQSASILGGLTFITVGVAGFSMGVIGAVGMTIIGLIIVGFMGLLTVLTAPVIITIAIVTMVIASRMRGQNNG